MPGQTRTTEGSIAGYRGILLPLLLLSFFSGCATRHTAFGERLDRGVGTMTYEEASRTWGMPKTIEEGHDTIMARWILERRVFVNIPMAAISGGVASIPYPLSQQLELELIFNRATDRLNRWTVHTRSLLSALRPKE